MHKLDADFFGKMMKKRRDFLMILTAIFFAGGLIVAAVFDFGGTGTRKQNDDVYSDFIYKKLAINDAKDKDGEFFVVARVIDGDTFEVNGVGGVEKVRVIGVNTPETVDPRKPVECFGVEASNKAKSVLSGQRVRLEYDPTQGERDKYGRLLRHVFLQDETNFGLLMIKDGYAHEYTYAIPYKYQDEFKAAQNYARQNSLGLWGDVCQNAVDAAMEEFGRNGCSIKGNINAQGEKIYHIAGCEYYRQTVVDESKGEKWFCDEQEALDAGWRKALNCP